MSEATKSELQTNNCIYTSTQLRGTGKATLKAAINGGDVLY